MNKNGLEIKNIALSAVLIVLSICIFVAFGLCFLKIAGFSLL